MIYSTAALVFIQFLINIDATTNSIPYSTRAHWMRAANKALLDLESPCPFAAFATVIVNHTEHGQNGLGRIVCMGVNEMSDSGNPTLHGELAAIGNCSTILTAKNGSYGMTPQESLKAFSQLSLYTNAESCPMCASAIRWSGFKEYIFGTSIKSLTKFGWGQIQVSSYELFKRSMDLSTNTTYIPNVLANETDPFFKWQFNPEYPCPVGCQRTSDGTSCTPSERK